MSKKKNKNKNEIKEINEYYASDIGKEYVANRIKALKDLGMSGKSADIVAFEATRSARPTLTEEDLKFIKKN